MLNLISKLSTTTVLYSLYSWCVDNANASLTFVTAKAKDFQTIQFVQSALLALCVCGFLLLVVVAVFFP